MRVAIIEDEIPAAEKLQLLLGRLDQEVEVLEVMDSVQSAVAWLEVHQDKVDLIFMDIQLLDGKSFDIFNDIHITIPVIFTTAYQEYSLDAFKVNSIDYLLKPITLKALETALNKFQDFKSTFAKKDAPLLDEIGEIQKKSNYKTRFMVKFGDHIRSVSSEDISYFYAEGRNVYIYTNKGDKYIIDFTLEELEQALDPEFYLRVNRSFIIQLKSVRDVLVYSNSRLKVMTEPEPIKEIIVSREKVSTFKEWFGG